MFTPKELTIIIYALEKLELERQEYIAKTKDNKSREMAQDQQYQIGQILKKLSNDNN